MKPIITSSGRVTKSRAPYLPPLTMPVGGKDITFVQVNNLMVSESELRPHAEGCPNAGEPNHIVMIAMCMPQESNFGMFIGMSPHDARDLADVLNETADAAETKILKGANHG